MKKSIIALAVAGALVAPLAQADATLYGSLRLKVQSLDGANELNVADNASRIGIKGSTELFSGAKGIFQWEQSTSTETGLAGARLASVGFTGDFGTLNAGRQWSPFATWTIFPTDIVDNGASGASGYAAGLHRLSNTVAYVSPNLSGFQVAAVIIADGDVTNGEDLDAYNLAAKYSAGGLTVAASHVGLEPSGLDVNSVAASYSMDAVYVAARFQQDERNGANEDSYELAGSYTMGNTKLLANFVDDDNTADEVWSVEVQQKLGKQARMFAAYSDQGASDGVEVGYRVDF